MGSLLDPFIAMWYRQVKRFWRAKPRVIGTFIQPIFWLLFFGLGFSAAFRAGGRTGVFLGLDYLSYLMPGVVLMTIFMGSFMSGISVIWDKEFGYLKVVLVSPASRKASIIGRSLGDATIAIIQGLVILFFGYLIVPTINLLNLIPFLIVSIIMSLSFASLGIIIATKMQTIEGFQLIINIITMPLLFLSGIFYPVSLAPLWIRVIALANPLTYAVDASRFLLLGVSEFSFIFDITLLISLSSIFLILAIYQFDKATIG